MNMKRARYVGNFLWALMGSALRREKLSINDDGEVEVRVRVMIMTRAKPISSLPGILMAGVA